LGNTFVPSNLLETEDQNSTNSLNDFFGLETQDLLNDFVTGKSSRDVHSAKNNQIKILRGDGLSTWKPRAELGQVLENWLEPDITISEDDIFYLHRVKDDFDLIYFVNTSQEDKGLIHISFEQTGRPELWDANTGEVRPLPVFSMDGGRLHIDLEFPASESHIVIINHEAVTEHISAANIHVDKYENGILYGWGSPQGQVQLGVTNNKVEKQLTYASKPELPPLKFEDQFDFALEDRNVFHVGQWKMLLVEASDDSLEYVSAKCDDEDWIPVKMGSWELQLPRERDLQEYPQNLWYRTTFEIDAVPTNTILLIDGFSGSSHRLFINGEESLDQGKRSSLDAEMLEIDIQKFLKKGTNNIAVFLVAERRTDGILDLLKIMGDFKVAESDTALAIVKPDSGITSGDWTDKGYPFFSGTGVYSQSIDIPAEYLAGKVFLEAECGEDVLEVIINDGDPLIRPWHPYRVDVSDYLVEGKNDFKIKITNTLINILEGVRQQSGLLKAPRLVYEPSFELNLKQKN